MPQEQDQASQLNAPTQEQNLTQRFEQAAQKTAILFELNPEDIRSAYAHKKEALTSIFSEANKARSDRSSWIGWSVAWLIFVPPIALYTGWKAYENHTDLKSMKSQVTNEIDRHRNSPSTSPFKTRIVPQ